LFTTALGLLCTNDPHNICPYNAVLQSLYT
jgi:hypothetical protein